MNIRFFLDMETGPPHIHRHGVTEDEVKEILQTPLEDGSGKEGARIAIGKTEVGRYLRVIYVPDSEQDSVFVVTAYDLGPKSLWALRRRLRGQR